MINLNDVYFISSCHQRYENNIKVGRWDNCQRAIKIEKNSDGGVGYTVTTYNLDLNHPIWGNNIQMAPKPMKIISHSEDKIILRGFGYDQKAFDTIMKNGGKIGIPSPDGSSIKYRDATLEDASFANYGITLSIMNREIVNVVLHYYDRNVYIEYLK
jgi:hypothetical protein